MFVKYLQTIIYCNKSNSARKIDAYQIFNIIWGRKVNKKKKQKRYWTRISYCKITDLYDHIR